MLSPRGCQAVGKLWDTALGVGQHSLRFQTQLELSRGPRAYDEVLMLLGIQALLDAVEELRTIWRPH